MNKWIWVGILASLSISCQPSKDLGQQTITVGSGYAEFKVPYQVKDGENPFDIIATSFFTSLQGSESRKAIWFYAKDSMRLRFAALEPGAWGFITQSDNQQLNGVTGSVNIEAQTDPKVNGYLIGKDKKWYWSTSEKATVPQLAMAKPLNAYEDKETVEADIEEYLINHGFNGLHIPSISMGWFEIEHSKGSYEKIEGEPNPNPVSFDVLEHLIKRTYEQGGILHFWWWGDESRKQTPVRWGVNGEVDLRLQRYAAARLGAIPGWSCSYGFDLPEWVTPDELQQWHDTLQQYQVVPHLISGRSKKHRMTPYAENLSYESYEHHRPDYGMYLEIYEKSKNKPVFSEDRYRIRNRTSFAYKDYTEALTFKGLWESTMAGGVANIWGDLALPDGKSNVGYSLPYENKEATKTYNTFFFEKERFTTQFEPVTDSAGLLIAEVPDKQILIAFQHDVIEVDLREYAEVESIKAVNTLEAYEEIDLIVEKAGNTTLPKKSDWAFIISQ